MNRDTRIALFLMGELVAALRANDSDLFKRWLYGGIEDLGEPAVAQQAEMLLGGPLSLALQSAMAAGSPRQLSRDCLLP